MTDLARRWQRQVASGRWAGLDFALELPEDWRSSLPDDAPRAADFDAEPARLALLLDAHSADGTRHLRVAARPSVMVTALVYSAVYLLGEQGIEIDGDDDDRCVGTCAALGGSGWASAADGRRSELRWACFEDGGRLVQLTLTAAPGHAGAPLRPLWLRLLDGFVLLAPRGQSQPLLSHPAPPPAPDAGPPAWWREAEALERDDRIDEALALIDRACPYAGALLAQAELVARRMQRHLEAGDVDRARLAHRRAAALAWSYAASATSGGEGAALSLERDRFLAQLGAEP